MRKLPVFFLPAMPCDERMYQAMLNHLADIIDPTVSVLAEPTFSDSARLLLSCAPDRFVLAGTAYGGCLALEVLSVAPERISGLWLMNCNPGVHPDPKSVRHTSSRIRNGDHRAVINEFAESAIPESDPASRQMFRAMAMESGAELFARQSDASLTRLDQWKTLETASVPTLLIWGSADRFVPLEIGQRIAGAVPHASFHSLTGCGHFPALERPLECAEIARKWIADNSFL
jgi:pimeloyl-ACP methyl ester carboxylesterase